MINERDTGNYRQCLRHNLNSNFRQRPHEATTNLQHSRGRRAIGAETRGVVDPASLSSVLHFCAASVPESGGYCGRGSVCFPLFRLPCSAAIQRVPLHCAFRASFVRWSGHVGRSEGSSFENCICKSLYQTNPIDVWWLGRGHQQLENVTLIYDSVGQKVADSLIRAYFVD
jgi:hypothetical protein